MDTSKKLFIEDLSAEQITLVEQRMRPHQYSRAGFLDANQSLREAIEADARVLQEHGITYKQIADRLESMVGKGIRRYVLDTRNRQDFNSYGEEKAFRDAGFPVEDRFRFYFVSWMGGQSCPFDLTGNKGWDRCGYGSSDFTVNYPPLKWRASN